MAGAASGSFAVWPVRVCPSVTVSRLVPSRVIFASSPAWEAAVPWRMRLSFSSLGLLGDLFYGRGHNLAVTLLRRCYPWSGRLGEKPHPAPGGRPRGLREKSHEGAGGRRPRQARPGDRGRAAP